MSIPRLLLLSGTTPGETEGGAIVLRDLCRLYPHDRIVSFSYQSPMTIPAPELGFLPLGLAERTSVGRFEGIPGGLRGLLRWLAFEYLRQTWGQYLRRQIVAFGHQHAVEKILVVTDDAMMIAVARYVAQALGVPMVALIWDAPELLYLQVGKLAVWQVVKDFERTLRASQRSAVVSQEMQAEYGSRYNIDTVVLCHSIEDEMRWPPAIDLVTSDELIIGFGGSIDYAQLEWYALLHALDQTGWRIGSRAVRIRYLGRHLYMRSTATPENIEFLGFRAWKDVTRLLAQTDVLYLPMPAYSTSEPRGKLSFPSKMITFLATGRPIFYHGPADGTAARLMQEYGPGISCHTHDDRDIVSALTRLVDSSEGYAQMTLGAQNAMDQEFSQRIFRQRFAQLLDLNESDLL